MRQLNTLLTSYRSKKERLLNGFGPTILDKLTMVEILDLSLPISPIQLKNAKIVPFDASTWLLCGFILDNRALGFHCSI